MENTEDTPIVSAMSTTSLEIEGTEKKSSASWTYRNQFFTSMVMCFGYIGAGYIVGFTSATMEEKEDAGTISAYEESWFAAIIFIGAIIGSLLSSFVVDLSGRKLFLMYSAVIAAVGWLLIVTDVHKALWLIGRTLCGINFGMCITIATVFLTEITSPSIRGLVLSASTAFINSGTLICFLFQLILSWRWVAVTACCFNALYILGLLFIPDSPHWLILKSRRDEAVEAVQWFRMCDSVTADSEVSSIEESNQTQRRMSLKDELKKKQYVRPILLAVFIESTTALSGYYCIISYVWQIAEDANIPYPAIISVVLGILQIIASLITAAIVDRTGRRSLLLIGGVTITIALLLLAIGNVIKLNSISTVAYQCSIFGMLLFFTSYNISWGTVTNAIMGEVLPTTIRGFCSGLSMAVTFFITFVLTLSFWPLVSNFNMYGVFIVYIVLNVLCTVLVALYLPETSNLSLEEIQKGFDEHPTDKKKENS